jgi:hypothetical protein
LDAGFGIAAAVDSVPLRAFTGVAVAERVLALGSTFVLMLAVAAGVAGGVDGADPAGAAGSVDVGAAVSAAGAGTLASLGGRLPLGVDSTFVLMLAVSAGVAGAVGAADPAGAAGSVDVGIAEAAAGPGKLVSFSGGIAMAVAPLFSGTASEVEFPVKGAI